MQPGGHCAPRLCVLKCPPGVTASLGFKECAPSLVFFRVRLNALAVAVTPATRRPFALVPSNHSLRHDTSHDLKPRSSPDRARRGNAPHTTTPHGSVQPSTRRTAHVHTVILGREHSRQPAPNQGKQTHQRTCQTLASHLSGCNESSQHVQALRTGHRHAGYGAGFRGRLAPRSLARATAGGPQPQPLAPQEQPLPSALLAALGDREGVLADAHGLGGHLRRGRDGARELATERHAW